ncbi:hypothetical protein BT63DRAFT_461355 [Microthyrium microscopicum]|uniref:Uncharacterized protein n=1 Tax=Microthyrium microscopicum TaxID=703497 RepID=A0A6A6TWA5_9PEZI|nr:hypothetical protein BT63DRAFT_461355 [Microthyrium microscopicum]
MSAPAVEYPRPPIGMAHGHAGLQGLPGLQIHQASSRHTPHRPIPASNYSNHSLPSQSQHTSYNPPPFHLPTNRPVASRAVTQLPPQQQQPPSPRFANFSHPVLQKTQSAYHPQPPNHRQLSQHSQHSQRSQSSQYSQQSQPIQQHISQHQNQPQRQLSASTIASSSSMASIIPSNNSNMYQPSQSRRTPSTSSNTSSPHTSVRRSSSSRSSNPTSYVALLRKQKATVWCDRSQAEDPRIQAAQRLAKERAEREVALLPGQSHGSLAGSQRRTPPNSTAGSFTSGVARKIRHHGATKATTFNGNMAGAGVPMRLSASEVDDDEEEGVGERLESMRLDSEPDWDAQFYAAGRTGSNLGALHGRSTSGTSGASGIGSSAHTRMRSAEATPTNHEEAKASSDYFAGRKADEAESSPEENEEEVQKKEDELRRRGSVDDRAMTMSGVRLFVANPDLDD